MAKVLVTGASGFIAGHVILGLLEQGYEVRGTVRSAAKGAGLIDVLSSFAGKRISIELVDADLTADGGWADAMNGCAYVQHVASPVFLNLPKDHEEVIRPAVDGTLRVLKAAKACGHINRVVLTSSTAAIAAGWGDAMPDLMDETHWSNPENLKSNTAYARSKTYAERAAWEYVAGEGAGLDLAVVNPSLVLGPVMSGDFSPSVEVVTRLMKRALPALPNVGFQIVDVRDVAALHILAMTRPEAVGERFAATSVEQMWFRDVAEILHEAYPDRKIPRRTMPDFLVRLLTVVNPALKQLVPGLSKKRIISNEKARRVLGWTPRPPREAILASAETLIKYGAV